MDWSRLLFHGDQLVGVRLDTLYQIDPQRAYTIEKVCKDKSTVGFLCETNDQLFWGKADTIRYASTLPGYTIIKEDNTWNDVTYLGGTYWVSDQYKGLQGYKIDDKQLQVTVPSIIPNSPVRNLSYRLQWAENRLLVAGGINTYLGYYNKPTSMYFEDNLWTNFEEMSEIPEQYSKINLANTTDLVQDPSDPSTLPLYTETAFLSTKTVNLLNFTIAITVPYKALCP